MVSNIVTVVVITIVVAKLFVIEFSITKLIANLVRRHIVGNGRQFSLNVVTNGCKLNAKTEK